jgi:hypothetical protein
MLLVLAVGLVACSEEGVPQGMKDVATENARFYLFVPESWISQSEGGINGATSPGGERSNVIVTTYLADQFCLDSTGYPSAAVYWANKCLPEYQATFTDLAMLTDGADTTLGGRNAKKYVYTAKLGGNTYQFMQVITADSHYVYTLTYTSLPEHYETYAADVDKICAEFLFR